MTSVYDHRALNLLGFIAEVKVGGHFMQPIALEEALSADVWPLSSLLPFETLRAQALAGQGWLVYNQDVDDVSGRAAAGLAEVVEQLRRQLRVKRNAKINANAQ